MAGPRSLSRSTKVAAPAGSRKGKGKHHKKKAPVATWNHDNSSADESVDEEPAAASASAGSAAASAGKKRPRVGAPKSTEEGAHGMDGGEAGTRKSSGGGSKRPRAAAAAAVAAAAAEEEEEEEESGSDGEDDVGEGGEDGNEEEEHGGGSSAAPAGGMGGVMARILGQKLDSRAQAPVLAKRKTKAMKEMENASLKRAESRGKSAARRANMTQQFVIPDHTTTDYERQLKKIATRGVVALFNAISKRQSHADGGAVAGAAKASAAKGASRHAFLDMLKTGVKPTGEAGAAAAAAGGKRAGGGTLGGAGAGAGADGGAEGGGRSWSVLKEDYMMGASSMKNWDQESADSEEDAIGGANDMSDDDSD